MKFLQILLEGRKEDFRKKYSNKFSEDQIDRIIVSVSPKYLDWVGKNLEVLDFDKNFNKLVSTLNKFDKISSNLPMTDINSYNSLDKLFSEIETYENKPRREYQVVEGGKVVYNDGRFFVVNPQNYNSSCYYGSGTKWCTASGTSDHFNRYNEDGKLFYILDKTKSTQDPFYKVALLKKFDGDETLWDAQDLQTKVFRGVIGEEIYDKIMKYISDYMNSEYSEQIQIYSDKERARKERERLDRLRIQRRDQQRRAEAESRRLDNEWELGPNCPDVGLKAHALLDVLSSEGFEIRTPQDTARLLYLKNYLDTLEERKVEFENENRDLTDLFAEYEATEDEIEELENKIDVYNLFPVGRHYDMTSFEILDSPLENRTYAVGDQDEVDSSARDYVEQMLDDVGYEGYNESFVMNYLDTDAIVDMARHHYTYDISDNPEIYFDESERQLSPKQEEQISIFKTKIENMNNKISEFENKLGGDFDEEIQQNIELLQDRIQDLESEIEDIENSPEGDFPDDLIDDKVEEFIRPIERDPASFLNDMGMDFKEYIDREEFIQGVLDSDDVGTLLNGYDGSYEEVKVEGETYYVMRID